MPSNRYSGSTEALAEIAGLDIIQDFWRSRVFPPDRGSASEPLYWVKVYTRSTTNTHINGDVMESNSVAKVQEFLDAKNFPVKAIDADEIHVKGKKVLSWEEVIFELWRVWTQSLRLYVERNKDDGLAMAALGRYSGFTHDDAVDLQGLFRVLEWTLTTQISVERTEIALEKRVRRILSPEAVVEAGAKNPAGSGTKIPDAQEHVERDNNYNNNKAQNTSVDNAATKTPSGAAPGQNQTGRVTIDLTGNGEDQATVQNRTQVTQPVVQGSSLAGRWSRGPNRVQFLQQVFRIHPDHLPEQLRVAMRDHVPLGWLRMNDRLTLVCGRYLGLRSWSLIQVFKTPGAMSWTRWPCNSETDKIRWESDPYLARKLFVDIYGAARSMAPLPAQSDRGILLNLPQARLAWALRCPSSKLPDKLKMLSAYLLNLPTFSNEFSRAALDTIPNDQHKAMVTWNMESLMSGVDKRTDFAILLGVYSGPIQDLKNTCPLWGEWRGQGRDGTDLWDKFVVSFASSNADDMGRMAPFVPVKLMVTDPDDMEVWLENYEALAVWKAMFGGQPRTHVDILDEWPTVSG